MYAFHDRALPQLRLRDSADTGRTLVIHVLRSELFTNILALDSSTTYFGLNTPYAAKLLVASFLPLGDQAVIVKVVQEWGAE